MIPTAVVISLPNFRRTTAKKTSHRSGNGHLKSLSPPLFTVKATFQPQYSSAGYVELLIFTAQAFPGPGAPTKELFSNPADGDFERVIYTLEVLAADNSNSTRTAQVGIDFAVVDQQNGDLTLRFNESGNYSVHLGARDASGVEATLEQWTIVVPKPEVFKLNLESKEVVTLVETTEMELEKTFTDANLNAGRCTLESNSDALQCDITAGTTFTIKGPAGTSGLFSNPVSNDFDSITFQIKGCEDDSCTCFTNVATGDSQCTWTSEYSRRRATSQRQQMELAATDG